MKVDENTQLFLLLVWVITLSALIAALWLFRDIKHVSDQAKSDKPAPYVIPPWSADKPRNKLEVPPPPF